MTAVTFAIYKHHDDITRLLIEYGADIDYLPPYCEEWMSMVGLQHIRKHNMFEHKYVCDLGILGYEWNCSSDLFERRKCHGNDT